MASSLDEPMFPAESDDDYTIEYYEYEIVDEKTASGYGEQPFVTEYNEKMKNPVTVETVEDDDDDDDYTYEEEEIVEFVMEDRGNDKDSTAGPPPLPPFRAPTTASPSKIVASGSAAPASHTPKAFKTLPKALPIQVPVSPAASPAYISGETELLTPSKQRAKAASSAGLSELSKQLRILQAKNESQAVDVNRLERQLKILADLQGISVGDLRKALEDACASEAFAELQSRLSKLKYELEAATLAKQAELRKETAAPHIANLELRVGELEEVEEKNREEIRKLYENLRHSKAESTRFGSENQQLKKALQDTIQRCQSETARAAQLETHYQAQIQDLRERQSKVMRNDAERLRSLNSVGTSSDVSISPEMAAEYEQMVQLLKQKDAELRDARAKLHADETQRAEKLLEAEEQSRKVQMDIKVESDKLAVTVKELEEADCQNGLRLAQYKARFTVQDERIEDMDQQLDSLYTAFTLLKEEFDSESDRHAAMLNNLNDADAEIARQTNQMERRDHGLPPAEGSTSNSSQTGESTAQLVPHVMDSPSHDVGNHRHSIATVAPAAPATPSVTNREYHSFPSDYASQNDTTYDYETPTMYATALPVDPSPGRTPSTWQLLFPGDQDQSPRTMDGDQYQYEQEEDYEDSQQSQQELIAGPLIVESNSVLRKWKTRPCKIYMRGEGYQWDIGSKRSFPIKFGISKVEFNPNYPLSFAVNLDPTMIPAPIIRAAATNERDYHQWMTALTKATSGEEYEGGPETVVLPSPASPTRVMQESSQTPNSAPRRSGNTSSRFSYLNSSPTHFNQSSIQSDTSIEDQEEAELRRALELSSGNTSSRFSHLTSPPTHLNQPSIQSDTGMEDQEAAELRRVLELSKVET